MSLALDSAVTISLWIPFPFEALGVSLQSFLHERGINTEVGPFEFLNHFREMEQMTLRGGFQNAQRARHDKTALQCGLSGTALIQQYFIGVNFLRQTDGFYFAPGPMPSSRQSHSRIGLKSILEADRASCERPQEHLSRSTHRKQLVG